MDSDSELSKSSSRSVSPNRLLGRPFHFASGHVYDIGGGMLKNALLNELQLKFLWKDGKFQKDRLLPASVLHDDTGLAMWTDMNRQPHYYQTNDEIELLRKNCKEIAKYLGNDCCLIDLGSGDIRKISPLLDACNEMRISLRYFALDLSQVALKRDMQALKDNYEYVSCYGLWGTFDNALAWVRDNLPGSPKCYVSLGSMFGNDHFNAAVNRLRIWRNFMGPSDHMLLGLDACNDMQTVSRSYSDDCGYFHKFIRNGFRRSNVILGHNWYLDDDWRVGGEIVQGEVEGKPTFMHQFVLTSLKPVSCEELGIGFPKGQRIVCYEGFKYGPPIMQMQFDKSGLTKVKDWCSPSGRIYQYLVERNTSADV